MSVSEFQISQALADWAAKGRPFRDLANNRLSAISHVIGRPDVQNNVFVSWGYPTGGLMIMFPFDPNTRPVEYTDAIVVGLEGNVDDWVKEATK